MLYYDYLKPIYAHQKSFYNKAYYNCIEVDGLKIYKLFSDNLKQGFQEVAKITIDLKHASKNRYFITSNKQLLDAVTLKHIYDFIYQFYIHKTTKNKLLRRNKLLKNKVFEYALQLD